jgi:hypothetical protein
VRRLLELYRVSDWPRATNARRAKLERLRARIEVEQALRDDDPEGLIARPLPGDEQAWDRLVDRWLKQNRNTSA